MRVAIGATMSGLLAAAVASAAQSQPAKGREPEPVERHFILSDGEIGDDRVVIEGVVREKRVGNRPAELQVDICFPVRADSGEIDRFAGPLTARRGGLSASGQSLIGRVKTELSLTMAQADGRTTLSGEILYGDVRIKLSDDSVDYEEGAAEHLFEKSTPAGQLAPNELMAKVEIGAMRPLLDLLRRSQAVVQPAQLVPGCADLREGKQYLRVVTSPARVPALVEAMKAVKGVDSVEAAVETSVREDGVRLPAKLAATSERALVDLFAAAARKALGGERTPEIRSNAATGEHLVVVTRDTRSAKALGLAEAVAATVLVAPDPYDKAKRILFVTQVGSKFVDPSANPLLLSQEMYETTSYTEIQPRRISAALSAAFAAESGGEIVQGSGRR